MRRARSLFAGILVALCVVTGAFGSAEAQPSIEIKALGPVTQRDFAILFVHGLSGSSKSFGGWISTVRADDREILDLSHMSVRLSKFDLFVVDYVSRHANVSIHEIGQLMARELQDSPLFQKYDQVWVVVHSMGGIVVHQATLQLIAQNKDVYFRFMPAVLELGVPVSGSEFANTAHKLADWVVSYLGFDPKLVSELRPGSNYLDSVNKQWTDLVMQRYGFDGWPIIFCGYETKYESEIARRLGVSDGIVVPNLYSSRACHAASGPVPRKHTELHHVTHRSDEAHGLLRQTVRESLLQLQRKRYVRSGATTLHQALTSIAAATAPASANVLSGRDRVTGLALYKYEIRFSDPTGATKSVKLPDGGAGWSVQDAARRLAHAYRRCLTITESPADGVISIEARRGAVCTP